MHRQDEWKERRDMSRKRSCTTVAASLTGCDLQDACMRARQNRSGDGIHINAPVVVGSWQDGIGAWMKKSVAEETRVHRPPQCCRPGLTLPAALPLD